MNRKETKKAIEVMQAYVDGLDLEWTTLGLNCWTLFTCSPKTWNFSKFEYRVKPAKPRVIKTLIFSNKPYDAIELTKEVREALEKAGIPYADK